MPTSDPNNDPGAVGSRRWGGAGEVCVCGMFVRLAVFIVVRELDVLFAV